MKKSISGIYPIYNFANLQHGWAIFYFTRAGKIVVFLLFNSFTTTLFRSINFLLYIVPNWGSFT